MSGKRYTDEQKLWYFKNIVEAGIPGRSNLALDMMQQEWGKAPSKSTLQYWIDPREKEKLRNRTQKYRKENINIIVGKRLDTFRKHTPPTTIEVPISENARTKARGLETSLSFTINTRISSFHGKGVKEMRHVLKENCTFLSGDILEFWQETQGYNPDTHDIICHVCGDTLNLITDTWHMDHIDPNGENILENCSCTHSVCNQFKSALTMEELVKLSKKVVNYHTHL